MKATNDICTFLSKHFGNRRKALNNRLTKTVKLLFVISALAYWKWANSLITPMSGRITKNVTFIHRIFPISPWKGVIIVHPGIL